MLRVMCVINIRSLRENACRVMVVGAGAGVVSCIDLQSLPSQGGIRDKEVLHPT